jgi:hypothetical protein
MADPKKSIFKRPDLPTTPVLGPEADKFVTGSSTTPLAEPVETVPATEIADQKEEPSTQAEKTKRLTIDIPLSLHKRVKSQCASQGTTIADVVRHFLERKFPESKV